MRASLALLVVLSASSSFALRLTGLNGSPTDASGNWHTGWYNTYGGNGDTGKNAFIVLGDNPNGAFINSGNSPTATGIDVDLTAPGRYKLIAFFDGYEIYQGRDFWSLNLFFNGANVNPAISVFGRPDYGTSQTPPDFWANSGRQVSVDAKIQVWGSGTKSATIGDRTVTLTNFRTAVDAYHLDRVNNFALGASGRYDHVAEMTLQVVPEPTGLAAIALGLITMLRLRRK